MEAAQIELVGRGQVDEIALEHELDKKHQSMQRRLKKRLMKRGASSAKRSAGEMVTREDSFVEGATKGLDSNSKRAARKASRAKSRLWPV